MQIRGAGALFYFLLMQTNEAINSNGGFAMNRNNSWIWGLAAGLTAGAGAMYFLDPDQGARRRALIRDKFVKWNRQFTDAVASTGRDLANRSQGMLAETRHFLKGDSNAIPTVEGGQGPLVEERSGTRGRRQGKYARGFGHKPPDTVH